MISSSNIALNRDTYDKDFTLEHYRNLLRHGIRNYEITGYEGIPWGERFLLWRHDIDYSLNRSLVLARIEHEEGIKATYFLNPHSEFYNIFEAAQHKIITEILSLGHSIGLHFDAAFYGSTNESELDCFVTKEATHLEWLFGVKPTAFSFHNPVAENLDCEADEYGGLVNCYSKRFKTEVSYCSDSNGYWRFRRLYEVLSEAKEPCLQVLTHPGWWQDKPMPPRQRIFRSVHGRFLETMRIYDSGLEQHGRLNHIGAMESLAVLKKPQPHLFELCDYLWNKSEFQTLFIELWRFHEKQIHRLCKVHLSKQLQIPEFEVNALFSNELLSIEGSRLFTLVFEIPWKNASGLDESTYKNWQRTRDQLIHGRSFAAPVELEEGCVVLCNILLNLANWGLRQPSTYDGLTNLASIGLPTVKTADGSLSEFLDEVKEEIKNFQNRRWEALKQALSELNRTNKDQS